MVSYFTAGSLEKDTIFGAARKIFGTSNFVMALDSTANLAHLLQKWATWAE